MPPAVLAVSWLKAVSFRLSLPKGSQPRVDRLPELGGRTRGTQQPRIRTAGGKLHYGAQHPAGKQARALPDVISFSSRGW
jgi:hypothetical protein